MQFIMGHAQIKNLSLLSSSDYPKYKPSLCSVWISFLFFLDEHRAYLHILKFLTLVSSCFRPKKAKCYQNTRKKMAKCEKYRNVTKIHANSRQNVKTIGMWPKYTQIHWLLLLCGSHIFQKRSHGIGLRQDLRVPAPDVDGPHVPQSSLKEIALRWSKRKRVALLDMEVCRDYYEHATDSEDSAEQRGFSDSGSDSGSDADSSDEQPHTDNLWPINEVHESASLAGSSQGERQRSSS